MGALADWLANSSQIQASGVRVGKQRSLYNAIQKIIDTYGDPARPSTFDAVNEVQSLAVYTDTVSSGNFTLTFTLWSGETFTTGNIAYNANAAAIESAIDSAATSAGIVGWTNGDISVSGGTLDSAPVVFTFDGDSVSGQNHPLITGDGSGLSADELGAITESTAGQKIRYSWAVLHVLNIITAGMPDQGSTPGVLTVGAKASANPLYPHQDAIRAIALQASIEDQNVLVGAAILDALGLAA